jgi:tetratricopeptide (TPR) repeat protein
MRRIILMMFIGLMPLVASAQTSIQVQTHNVVSLDEQFTVSFVIEGNRPEEFDWDPGDDFNLVWGPQQGRSSSVQIINGKRTESSQTTYSYILRPLNAGKFTLPRARAVVAGKEIYSSAAKVEVIGAGSSQANAAKAGNEVVPDQSARASSSARSGQDVFMVLSLDRTNVVVGEPIKAVLKLYQKTNIVGFEGADFPDFDGFWSQETLAPANIQFERESYGGQIYNSAVLREYALIPQHAGTIEISPAELVCLVNVRVSSGGSSMFDGFFDEYTTVRKKVRSQAVKVNVKPLPSGAPSSFAGGVGVFDVEASLSRDSLAAHEAVSLILRVSGRGNISLLETPKITFPLDMESYDPKVTGNVASNGLSGVKVYEYPFIPRSAGDFEIGPVRYSYYDVDRHEYVTIDAGTLSMHVARGNDYESEGVTMSVPSRRNVENRGSDIRYISTKVSGFARKGEFFVGSTSFRVLTVLLCLLALAVWILFRKVAARRADVAGTRNRKATKMALKRLRYAGSLLKKNQYSEFYAELHNALLGYMSDKLTMPVSELSKDRMSEVLMRNGVLESYVQELMEILDSCEYARYAPSSGNQAMTSDYEKAVEVISSIDSGMKTRKGGAGRYMAVGLLLMCSIGAEASHMSQADSLWNAGNSAYAEGKWIEAVDDYMAISDMGLESADLYYNIGDAWFKAGDNARAVLYFERALRLDPAYEDAEYNLELVRGRLQDDIETVPEFFLKEWLRSVSLLMSSDAWAVMFIILLSCTLSLLLVFLLSSSLLWKRVGFFTAIVTLVLMVASLSFSLWQKNDYMAHDEAVVMKTVTSVKSSPSTDNSTDLFILHEGTKVTVLESVGAWTNVSLADGRQGWMKTSDIERI